MTYELENLLHEKGYTSVCGVDEAGRGPLAGPVFAAAVILPDGLEDLGINDSKKLSEKKRDALFDLICEKAIAFSVASADEKEIDEINILNAKEASKFSPTDSRSFKIIEELCKAVIPQSIVAPYLVMGGTDAYHYEPICENINRFAPFALEISLLRCAHGTNERLPISCMENGLVFFKNYIRRASAEN